MTATNDLDPIWSEKGDDGLTLPQTSDCRIWARALEANLRRDPEYGTEEALMGWFANAIMAGYDRAHWQSEDYKTAVKEALEAGEVAS